MNKEYLKIAGAVILPNLGGFYGAGIVKRNINTWFEKLNLPAHRPPNWLFAPAWTTLYSSMGYASYLVWKDGGGCDGDARLPLALYATQLALNWIWTPIFFGKHELKASVITILATTATAALTGCAFYKINPIAGFIFIPYVTWLSFASHLNYSIYKNNPPEAGKDK